MQLSYMDKKPIPTFQCQLPSCGKIQERRLCKSKTGRSGGYDMGQKFCSKECGWKGRAWRPISEIGYVHSAGYQRLNLRGGKKIYQHRKIMAQCLGRDLQENENVHHKDGNRLNNDLSNLELWSKMQPPGQRVIDKVNFAIEILTLYPEFARTAGYELRSLVHPTASPL